MTTHHAHDRYHITGVRIDGKRFKLVTSNPIHAFGINLWRGSVWFVPAGTGKRRLVKRVMN